MTKERERSTFEVLFRRWHRSPVGWITDLLVGLGICVLAGKFFVWALTL